MFLGQETATAKHACSMEFICNSATGPAVKMQQSKKSGGVAARQLSRL